MAARALMPNRKGDQNHFRPRHPEPSHQHLALPRRRERGEGSAPLLFAADPPSSLG